MDLSKLDDPTALLAKLKHETSAAEYYKQFIKISHQVEDISIAPLVSLFLSRLREEIHHSLKLDRPHNVITAYRLASARENIMMAQGRAPRKHVSTTLTNNSIGKNVPTAVQSQSAGEKFDSRITWSI